MNGSRILVLPEETINQIAAGEVVENAASVVKELVENALDAGARRIGIRLEGGGLQHIEVWDDGCGMSPEEAPLALQRHATSKIRRAEDLDRLATLGFRGEALPSIASVSRFSLVTRRVEDEAGVRIDMTERGLEVRPAACPPGTRVTVADLFFNVPARRKFQRSERAQTAAVMDTLLRIALAHPEVHITLASGAREVLDLPPTTDLIARALSCLGKDALGAWVRVRAQLPGRDIEGILGEPSRARADSSRLVLLVNRRPVQDLGLRRSLMLAYGILLPQGRFPAAVLHLLLDPAEVDVNVHPRKTEVRFRNAREVQSAVFEACLDALATTSWVDASPGRPAEVALPVPPGTSEEPGPSSWDGSTVGHPPEPQGLRESLPVEGGRPPAASLPFPTGSSPSGRWSRLRFVGQVGGTVLVLQGTETLVLVDQHAAHERVNYDALWKGLQRGTADRDALLFPEVVHLEAREAARMADGVRILQELGFDLEVYGDAAIVVRAQPAILRGRAVGPVIREVVAALADESTSSGMEPLQKAVATVACHASVRAGDSLSEEEVRRLLAAMDQVEDLAAYCPHGRQAVVVFPLDTVLRWFGR